MLTKDQQQELARSIKAEQNFATACAMLQDAFGKPLLWHVQFKIADFSEAHDVVFDTWELVVKKIHKYDETRASLYRFACLYADGEISRYFEKKKKEEKLTIGERIACVAEEITPEEEIILRQNAQEQLRKYDLLLATTLRFGGQAHHILAFGFSEIIFPLEKPDGAIRNASSGSLGSPPTSGLRQESRRGRVSGCPRRVVTELSDTVLRQLSQSFEEKYEQYSMMPKQATQQSFKHLKQKMKRQAKNRQISVGETCLHNYYGKDPEHNVSDWAYKVKQRVKQFILRRKSGEWSGDN